jgi:hypothetical protein
MIEPAMPHTARDTRLAPAVTPTLRLLEVMNTANNRGTTAPIAKLRQLEVMNTVDNKGTAAPTAKRRQLVKAACQGDDSAYFSMTRRFLVGSWGFE